MTSFNKKLPTIKQLQCFLAVAHELNFRRAAERMRMTQPPLTRQIQCLEEVIGCSLFTRDTHQVHLTESGIKLEEQAKQLISQLSHLVQTLNVESDTIKIGVTRTLDFSLIPTINAHLETLLDTDNISAHQLTSKQLLQILARGNLDIVLVGEKAPDSDEDFEFSWLHREPLMLALPSAHPASINDTLSLHDVIDLPLYWFSRNANPGFYDKCENALRSLPFTLKRKAEPDDSLIMLANIARGKGMALMPQSMCVSIREGLCYRHLDPTLNDKLNIDVYLVTRKNEKRINVLNTAKKILASVSPS
ncbi:LysR family transcriptional regulator [Serratia sp. NPDC078593]|uniref:LysR family transcriptional regulator n=1 Tax=unclassified Serratia (in: enterobacteria) TaxID=2647522 RepID=UPI0037CD9D29